MDLPAHQVPLQDVRTWVHQQELLATRSRITPGTTAITASIATVLEHLIWPKHCIGLRDWLLGMQTMFSKQRKMYDKKEDQRCR